MNKRRCGAWLACAGAVLGGACRGTPALRGVLTETGDRIAVTIGGQAFCEYRSSGARRPVLWPLFAPGGIAVTRAFPFAEVQGEPRDHDHHESLWFAHGDVRGVDFWAGDGRIVEQQHDIDPTAGTLHGVSSWRDQTGSEICRDFHSYAFRGGDDWRTIDLDLTLVASNGDVDLGDTKEGTFALRLRPELSLRGGGTIENSAGDRDAAAWGKRARWVAYRATVQGRDVVVAVFDHPGNHGFPTHWHARDYGLVAANPFGLHDFVGAAPGTGTLHLAAGCQLPFRYRVLITSGGGWIDRIDAAWDDWVAGR